MPNPRQAGSIVLPQLRERILSGSFLGAWQPGARLPSIRDVADAESVDRKTAAAAYRRLAEEGLVRVRARSGVYLAEPPATGTVTGPLERLQRQWLEQTFDGARALGLSTNDILKFVHAVAEVEARQIPVIECDRQHSESLAREIRARLDITPVPLTLAELDGDARGVENGSIVVTTAFHTADIAATLPDAIIVEATLDEVLLERLRTAAERGAVAVIVPSRALRRKLDQVLDFGLLRLATRPRFAWINDDTGIRRALAGATEVLLWPGVPARISDRLPTAVSPKTIEWSVSRSTLDRLRGAILEAARRRMTDAEDPERHEHPDRASQ